MAKKKTSAKKTIRKKVTKKTPTKKVIKKTALKKKASAKKVAAKKAVKASAQVFANKAKSTEKARPVAKKLDLSGFVTPLDDRLMVQISSLERRTPGGLYIPETVSDVSGNIHARVVAVGRGHLGKKGHIRPMDVKVGDNVVFPEHAGSTIKIQNEDLVILREVDVMGIVSK